jgi:hypothetical protein
MEIVVTDRSHSVTRGLANIYSDEVPSGMPTPISFPTSYPTGAEMPTGFPTQQDLTAPSAVPSTEFDSKSDEDDDLAFSVPKDVEGMDTSTNSHHSLPSGTFSCVLIINVLYHQVPLTLFNTSNLLTMFLFFEFFPTVALVVVISVTCLAGMIILVVSFLMFLKMRAVNAKSISTSHELDAIPIAQEVVWSKGPVLVVEANLTSNI